jgi:hypothetical protein
MQVFGDLKIPAALHAAKRYGLSAYNQPELAVAVLTFHSGTPAPKLLNKTPLIYHTICL